MAKLYRMKEKDGVYLSLVSGRIFLIHKVYMSQFYDTQKNVLVELPTATIEGSFENVKDCRIENLDKMEYIGKF